MKQLILTFICTILLTGCLWGSGGLIAKPGGYYGSDEFEYNKTANYSYPGWSKYNNYDIMQPQYKTQLYDHYGLVK